MTNCKSKISREFPESTQQGIGRDRTEVCHPKSWSTQPCSAMFACILSQQKRTERIILIKGNIFNKKNTLLGNPLVQCHKKQQIPHNIVQSLFHHQTMKRKATSLWRKITLEERPHASRHGSYLLIWAAHGIQHILSHCKFLLQTL